jgi:hypothetical protein
VIKRDSEVKFKLKLIDSFIQVILAILLVIVILVILVILVKVVISLTLILLNLEKNFPL